MPPQRLPSSLELLWLSVWRPLELRLRLATAGVDAPSRRVGALWSKPGPSADYARRGVLVILLWTPLIAAALAGAALLLHLGLNLRALVAGVIVSLLFGVGSALVANMALGWMLCFWSGSASVGIFGLAFGGSFGVPQSSQAGLVAGTVLGAAMGLAVGSYLAFGRAEPPSVVRLQAMSIATAILAAWTYLGGIHGRTAFGAALSMSELVAFVLFAFRLPLWPVEASVETCAYLYERLTGRSTIALAPIFQHELTFLPHPFLRRHVLLALEHTPALGMSALWACTRCPAHRRWALEVMAQGEDAAGPAT